MEDMLNELSSIKAKRAGITDKQEPRMSISDPTAIKALVTPDFPLKNIPSKLKLLIFSLSLYYWGVPYAEGLRPHSTAISIRSMVGLS